MKNLPDKEAGHVWRQIREGIDATSLLNYLKTGNVLLQMAVAPETRFRYELPYRTEMPEYYLGDNPYIDSMIYGASSLYPKTERSKNPGRTATSRAGNRASNEYQGAYLKPFHAAEVIDPRLTDAKISSWTAVCKDDVLMRQLLSVFLRCEYHLTSAFQKDYFLDDLVANRKKFCSSLLVNVVLAYSCVRYSPLILFLIFRHVYEAPLLMKPRSAIRVSQTVLNTGIPKRSCIASLWKRSAYGSLKVMNQRLQQFKPE